MKNKLSKKQKNKLFREVISSTPVPDISIENFIENRHSILPLGFNCEGKVTDNKGNVVDATVRLRVGKKEQLPIVKEWFFIP